MRILKAERVLIRTIFVAVDKCHCGFRTMGLLFARLSYSCNVCVEEWFSIRNGSTHNNGKKRGGWH
jgi:hypothetical protein